MLIKKQPLAAYSFYKNDSVYKVWGAPASLHEIDSQDQWR